MDHHHEPSHYQPDITEANRQHFNETAHTYDARPMVLEVTREIGNAMLKAYSFDENLTTVMDFACGTGARSDRVLGSGR